LVLLSLPSGGSSSMTVASTFLGFQSTTGNPQSQER